MTTPRRTYAVERILREFQALQTAPIGDLEWEHARCGHMLDQQRHNSALPDELVAVLHILRGYIQHTERTRRRGAAIAQGEHVDA